MMTKKSSNLKAIILAAGMGTRLGILTAYRPKCLIEIGGKPLIHYTLCALKAVGLSKVVIVLGYYADMVRNFIGDKYNGISIDYAYNADYSKTGSMLSLKIASTRIRDGNVLVLESDLLFHPAFLKIAVTDLKDNIMMAADPTGSGDEVYLCSGPDGVLNFLGKNAPKKIRKESVGEFAGITKMSQILLREYEQVADKKIAKNMSKGHYEELIFTISKINKFYVRHCRGYPWTEIDTPIDLERANLDVYPKIKGMTIYDR